MRGKLLVTVLLAATRQSFEMLLPLHLGVCEVTDLIEHVLASRAGPLYEASGESRLMYMEGLHRGSLLRLDACVGELVAEGELVDGSVLALA